MSVFSVDIQDAASDVQRINMAISQAVGSVVDGRPVALNELMVLVGAASELASDKAELIKASASQAS
ncbi:hypothetical protein ABAC460_10125 [Asticcacaulis sp. AC460]|uniref:hypothetical protein n=1 Tax=Asticcacaulis sp. AC460 TaxID=1282360 RepID=UPI0003C3CD6A|nr:hypothetical protein [Asticcacaulis sp. AC460]ESQ90114.1 hypothetical protein ABAC460_10125 [Asticcacaulis sp. AC460]